MVEFLCVYCNRKTPEKESHICSNCNRIFCKEHHLPTTHNCKKMENPAKTLPKATKKQEYVAGMAIAGFLLGGIFAVIFGLWAITDLPEKESDEYLIWIGILIVPFIAGAYGLQKLFSRHWDVRF